MAALLASQCKLCFGVKVCSSVTCSTNLFNAETGSFISQTINWVLSFNCLLIIAGMTKLIVTKLEEFTGHQGPIYALCNGPTNDSFYSGSNDGNVGYWQAANNTPGKLLIKVGKPVYALSFIKQLNWLCLGTNQGTMHVFDLNTMAEIKNIEAHQGAIFDIQNNQNHLITVGFDGNVKIWNLPNFELLANLSYSSKSARCIAFHPSNQEIAVGYSDHQIRVFSLVDYTLKATLSKHSNSVFTVAYNLNGSQLLSGGRDVLLNAWQVSENYSNMHSIAAHTLHINHIVLNPSGDLFATVSMDKTIKIWDGNDLTLLKVINFEKNAAHLTSINKLVWLNNHTFVTASDDKKIMQWQLT